MDAAVGVVERGSWAVKDAVKEIPWLPDGPIPVQVDWQLADMSASATRPTDARYIGDGSAVRRRCGSGGDGMTSAIVVGSGPNGLAAALTLACRRAST